MTGLPQSQPITPITGVVMAHIIGAIVTVMAVTLAYLLLTDWLGRWMMGRRYRKLRRRRDDRPQQGGG